MNELVTIVIPCKNEEHYIGHLLGALCEQGVGNTRIIVADANSTDNTVNIVDTFKYELNIEVIAGGRVSVGRNNGAKLATTPYILFLDADVRFFHRYAIHDALLVLVRDNLDLVTLHIKNYGTDWKPSFFFSAFNVINHIMTKYTPFAVGAFFFTRRDAFEALGGFPDKYDTSEDYILSKQYAPNKFKICSHYVGQDDRRFTKVGYFGMIWFMIGNFFNRHNLAHFKKANVEYWK